MSATHWANLCQTMTSKTHTIWGRVYIKKWMVQARILVQLCHRNNHHHQEPHLTHHHHHKKTDLTQATVIVLITCSLLVTSRQYIGGKMNTSEKELIYLVPKVWSTQYHYVLRWPHWLHRWPRCAPERDGHLLLDPLDLQHSQPIRGSQWGVPEFENQAFHYCHMISSAGWEGCSTSECETGGGGGGEGLPQVRNIFWRKTFGFILPQVTLLHDYQLTEHGG